jgi:hypothetical protein
LKIQKKYKKLGLERKMSLMCSHLGPTTHVTLLMNRGAPIWFKTFGVMVYNFLIIEPFFHRFFFLKPRLKTILEYGGLFGIIGKPSTSLI